MPLDVTLLRQLSTESLTALLRGLPGEKDVVIEPSLMKPLDKIAGMTVLKSCGVRRVFKLSRTDPPPSQQAGAAASRVYLLTSSLIETKYVLDQLRGVAGGNSGLTAYIVFVPKVLQSLRSLVEEEGLADVVHTMDFMWQLMPLDSDLFNLELPNFFKTTFVKSDLSLLSSVTKSVFGLETLFGKIPNRVAVGLRASHVLDQLEVLESNAGNDLDPKCDIGHLFLVDRDVDFASCLLSPVTYEALLDEVFGIKCGAIDFGSDPNVVNEKLRNVKLQISTKDKVFENIRFKHFSSIFTFLSENAKQLQHQQAKTTGMNVTEMKQFVQNNLRDLQSQSKAIAIHIGASEAIQASKGNMYEQLLPIENALLSANAYKEALSFAEDSMAKLYPMELVLRLLALISLTQSGFASSDYQRVKRSFCEAYGFKHLATLEALRELGLFNSRSDPTTASQSKSTFQSIAARLDLLPGKNSTAAGGMERNPSFVFNGIYTPAVCRIVSAVLNSSNSTDAAANELKNLVPGHKFVLDIRSRKSTAKFDLVYFVGGYTLAEVAALRTVQATTGRSFLIAGTTNVTGKDIIKAFM